MSGRWDGSLGGVNFRIQRTEEGATYRKVIQRTNVENQVLGDGAAQSRADQPGFLQSNWQGGSAWWKPLIAGIGLNSFTESSGFDSWSSPGNLTPVNDTKTVVVDAPLGDNPLVVPHFGETHALGSGNTVNASYYDVQVWNAATGVFDAAAYTSGVPVTYQSRVIGHFELDDGTTARSWVLATSSTYPNSVISNYQSSGFTASVFDNTDTAVGSSFFPHVGNPWYYNGDTLTRINDPYGAPAKEVIEDDGHGVDFLDNMGSPGSPLFRRENINLAIPTTEGIYYVKNVRANNTVTPFIYRVEVDANGSWTGIPISTLNPGSIVLDLHYHQGSLVMSVTEDIATVLANDASDTPPKMTLYHLTGGSLGVLGQPVGFTFPEQIESVWKFLGSDGPLLYVGGGLAVWVYDAVRGGIVRLTDHALPDGYPASMQRVADSGGETQMLFLRGDDFYVQTHRGIEDPKITATFGTDKSTYYVESGYFDFGLPMEQKTVSKLTIQTDPVSDSQRFTVELVADDGPYVPTWTEVATHSNNNVGTAEYTFTPIAGYRFRYRIYYETKTAANKALKAIYFTATAGQRVRMWDIAIDNTEFRNVENEWVDPRVMYELLETAVLNNEQLTYVDEFEEYEAGNNTSYTVKVTQMSNDKGNPNEGGIRLTLVEV